jgi:tetratricopeptide (TPR) repeat protein
VAEQGRNTPAGKTPADAAKAAAAADRKVMSVKDAVATATRLYNAGKLREAENLLKQIVQARPQNADAHNILGVIAHREGRTEDGIRSVREAIRLNPSSANYYSNLGEMERKAGNLENAVNALRRSITLDPNGASAHNNLGIVHYEQDEFDKAADCYRMALKLDPNYAEAHNNLGNAMRGLGDIDAALEEYERAIDLRENYAEAYNNMGTALRDLQKTEEAEFSYRRAIEVKPNYLEALNNLAGMLTTQKRYDDALRILGDTLREFPTDPGTLVAVSRVQCQRGAFDLAERAAEIAIENDKENADAYCALGQVCQELDRFDEAVENYRKALAIKPEHIESLNFLGITLKSLGRMDEARDVFMKALELQPKAIGAYSNIVDLEQFTADHPLFKAMNEMIENAKNPQEDRFTALHFALGKANDDIGNHVKAFEHYATGARLKRAMLKYDEADTFSFFDEIRKTFDADFIANPPFKGNPTSLPIFIVGMPRSGSTLTEQIISSHGQVFGAGEIKTLSLSLGQLRQRYPNLPKYPAIAKAMKPAQYKAVADAYLDTVSKLSDTALRVTDKLLTNYYFVGFIHTLFPNAKIVHTMRNPIDTCWSSFTKLFKDDMPHSYDLGELGRYYRKYQEIMEHWRSVLPAGVMLDVRYEDVVADTEGKAREIIAFLGLDWDERCLAFHESDRPVKTASVSQVRKPVYTSSVDRFRRYGDSLDPLLAALESGTSPAA